MTCSAPPDCAEIERRHATGNGLLVDGGASRGNLLSGEADDVILTVSRMDAEKKSNPGYRAFLADGDNVTRTLVLFLFEIVLEWTAALRGIRRDVRPRGHRGGIYPIMRAAMCVFVRDLIVSGVLTDMMRGRPAVYATFSSYDEVAHHSGLERADTLEALRKLDGQFAQIERARRYAPRPYEIVVLSDHGQTQGATFKQRNGYGLDELVERSLARGDVSGIAGGDEQSSMVGLAVSEATGKQAKRPKKDVSDRDVVVLGSGNLGLVYLMEEPRRLTLEEIEERHPKLLPALREHPHVGWLLVHSAEHGAVALGARGAHYLTEGRVEGEDPLASFSPTAPRHLLRTDGFQHVGDIMVGSFYDPELDEGCAFEELICFHGGLGGVQTRPFILHPAQLEVPPGPILGAASVHGILSGWRRGLQSGRADEQRERSGVEAARARRRRRSRARARASGRTGRLARRRSPASPPRGWRRSPSFVAPAARASATACWNEAGAASTAMVAATRTSAAVRSSMTDAADDLPSTAISSRRASSCTASRRRRCLYSSIGEPTPHLLRAVGASSIQGEIRRRWDRAELSRSPTSTARSIASLRDATPSLR